MEMNSQSASREKQIEDLLTAVFTLCLLDSSIADLNLESIVARCNLAARKKAHRLRSRRPAEVDFDVLGHVIYIWQRTAAYLDDEGKPLAIAARGPAPSVQALFRDVRRSSYFEKGLKHLLEVKRIKRQRGGRYLPCSEVTIVNGLTPELVSLLNQTINRLVSTVLHNTAQRNSKALRLVERVTAVPDLPVKQVRAFKVFAREQGGALINTMNEWLESRRGAKKARSARADKNQTAGLHVFAFVERNSR
jgi:Family of unknown function (DUF6502)